RLMINEKGEEILRKNVVLNFFILSGVEFFRFFQKFKNARDLLDELIKIRRYIRFKAQGLVFDSWLRYGIDELVKDKREWIVSCFLQQCTGKNIYALFGTLINYLQISE